MMNSEVEAHIKNNFSWNNLPANVKQTLGNNESNWQKSVSDYCIKNQYRWKGSIVKQVRKDEKRYYQELIQYSRQNLMLYPYHLADIVVKGLRLTPFSYYCNMMQDIMASEKSYDSLPNFTAADCLRLMGIGRNQYIEMMNQCKSSKRFFRARRPPRELLPIKPIPQTVIRSWWITNPGYITDDDVKMCAQSEVKIIDTLIDDGPRQVKVIDDVVIDSLYNKGLVYFDVPIQDTDHIVVPPLENFVMNRVLGDYMETMLYKVFVSIDEVTTVRELAQVLEIDLPLVKNAISLFCRLGLAQRKGADEEKDGTPIPPVLSDVKTRNFGSVPNLLDLDDFSDKENGGDLIPVSNSTSEFVVDGDASGLLSPDSTSTKRRMAFLFDSTLTAFLMMGNLSQGLKRHAVTMFEVGKLSDETMENFISELEKIEIVGNEGEAQRYFDHAVVLKETIQFMRNNNDISIDQDDPAPGLDLVRCESMNSLDPSVCAKILMKKYSLLISMAPLSNEIRPISSCTPPHIGPAIPEVNSMWFKLFLYSKVKNGPPSLLLVKGTRLRKLPKMFMGYDRLLITTWGHDPAVVPTSNVLFSLNDALTHSPVLVQAHGWFCEGEVKCFSFPFEDEYVNHSSDSPITDTLHSVHNAFNLTCTCGYVTLINLKSTINSKTRRGMNNIIDTESLVVNEGETDHALNEASYNNDEQLVRTLEMEKSKSVTSLGNSNELTSSLEDTSSTWLPLQLCYGIPLFDGDLNKEITKKIISFGICKEENLSRMTNSNRMLSLELLNFITEWQEKVIIPASTSDASTQSIPYPSKSILFNNGALSIW